MERVIPHRQVADPKTHSVSGACDRVFDCRKHLAVEGPQIEVEHDRRIGSIRTRVQRPVVQHETVVALHRHFIPVARMDDEHAHHPHRHLRQLVRMRVIHVGAVLLKRELIRERFARHDRWLGEPGDAIHPARQDDAVPVHRRRFAKLVGDEQSHTIALDGFDGRPGCRAVIAPHFGLAARRELVLELFGDEMKLLHSVSHPERE